MCIHSVSIKQNVSISKGMFNCNLHMRRRAFLFNILYYFCIKLLYTFRRYCNGPASSPDLSHPHKGIYWCYNNIPALMQCPTWAHSKTLLIQAHHTSFQIWQFFFHHLKVNCLHFHLQQLELQIEKNTSYLKINNNTFFLIK